MHRVTFSGILLIAMLTADGVATAQNFEADLSELASVLLTKMESQGQRSATVLDFTDLQGQPTQLGRFLAQELSDQLVSKSHKLSLVDRANLQHVLREHKLTAEGLVNPESSAKLGRAIGIDTVILGTTTPLENRVRLSVRAISVETGKIVATQSATLAAPPGVAGLFNQGVPATETTTATPRTNLRDRLRSSSLKLVGRHVRSVTHELGAMTLNFSLENLAGTGLAVGIRAGGTSIGPCSGNEVHSSGIPLIDFAPESGAYVSGGGLRPMVKRSDVRAVTASSVWLPPGATITSTMKVSNCMHTDFEGLRTVPVTITFVLSAGDEVAVVPASYDPVPVHVRDPYRY